MNLKQRLYKWLNPEIENEIAFLRHEREKFMAFDPKRVLTIVGGRVNLAGYELTEVESRVLKEEAVYLTKTELWGIFQNTLTETARKVMFEKSKDFDDMRTGKAMLYNLDVQKKIIEKILELK